MIPITLLVSPFFIIYWFYEVVIGEWLINVYENKKRARKRIQDLIEGRLRLDGVANSEDSSFDDDEIRPQLNPRNRDYYDERYDYFNGRSPVVFEDPHGYDDYNEGRYSF